MNLEEALEKLHHRPDRVTLETYIARAWVRPVQQSQSWQFDEVDVARAQLVHQLREDLGVDTEALDTVLHLMDQLYAMREQMRRLRCALENQPHAVKDEIQRLLEESREARIGGNGDRL